MEPEKMQAAAYLSLDYERWEEVYLSSRKGKQEVRYYLKKKNDSGLDLPIIGKEKSSRHMSYHYTFEDNYSSLPKLRSRRDVVDWLNSVIPPDFQAHLSIKLTGSYVESKNANGVDYIVQGGERQNLGQHANAFMWLGSPWTCRKRRRHYQSFFRNGVEISVHDFVYVLAEEDERIVAHLDDMYVDSKGRNMVVVQWFHKIDDVGIVLPKKYNNREILFSLCFQDLSIECIDGLATVLSPQHYEKFLNDAKDTQLEPFICHRQFDNDEIKPLDITQVKGYWKQDAVRYMSFSSPTKSQPSIDGLKLEGNTSDAAASRPKKRLRLSRDSDMPLQSASFDATFQDCGGNLSGSGPGSKAVGKMSRLIKGQPDGSMCKSTREQKYEQQFTIGSQVEVLSQDSGIRGCWFPALIVKKHKDKVKVRYLDVNDVTDDAKSVEEWVLASRLAATDELGIRISGRTIVRPVPLSNKGKVPWVFNIGTPVDVWWNDGWWEGIIVKKVSEDQLQVYFPGEKQELAFASGDLRHSHEWFENEWKQLRERSDLVSILSGTKMKLGSMDCSDVKPQKATFSFDIGYLENHLVDLGNKKLSELEVVNDLSKDDWLLKLRWKSSKRRRIRSPVHKAHYGPSNRTENGLKQQKNCQKFNLSSSLQVDPDSCKYISDSHFNSSIRAPLSNLVMSRCLACFIFPHDRPITQKHIDC